MTNLGHGVELTGSFEPLVKGFSDKTERGILRGALRRTGQQVTVKEARNNLRSIGANRHTKSVTVKTSVTNFVATARIGAKRGTVLAKIGHLLEKGTRGHVVESKTDISDIATQRTRKKLMVGRKTGIIYGTRVRHPGARKKPWMNPALEDHVPRTVSKFTDLILEEIDKAVAKGKR